MKELSGYVTVREFDGVNLPITVQHNLMRAYSENINAIYKLAQTELVVSNSSFVLFSILRRLKKNGNLIMCSIFMLPDNKKKRIKILNYVNNKKIKLHFVFENFVVKNEKTFFEVEQLLELKKLINNNKPQKYLKLFNKFKSIN